MCPHRLLVRCSLLAVLLCSPFVTTQAKTEDWTDSQGNQFRAEPLEILGPLAIFRTGRSTARRVPLQMLPPGECVRLYQALRDRPPRADTWAKATGKTTRELIDHVMRVENGKLVPPDFSHRPEPEVMIVMYVSNGVGESWGMLSNVASVYTKLQTDFPGMVDAVMVGMKHSRMEHANMAVSANVPWLATELHDQALLESLLLFAPESYGLMVLTRDGAPLFSADSPNAEAVARVMADLTNLLQLTKPENPQAWPMRVYYLSAVQPVAYAHGHADPQLVGNPLMAEGLKQRKVYRFDADLHISAEGSITSVEMHPDELLPEKMAKPIAEGLKHAVVVPAVQDGKFVDGVYKYHFEVAK